jgi:hypothetical protein
MENPLRVLGHVTFRCELNRTSAIDVVIDLCLEMKNTRNILVKIGFVPFPVNYASGCVVGTIYMA